MQIDLECLPCFLKQTVALTGRLGLSEQASERAALLVIDELRRFRQHETTAKLAREVNRILQQASGMDDPYLYEKRKANAWMSKMLDEGLLEGFEEDGFRLRSRLAVAGNVIDLGAFPTLDLGLVRQRLEEVAKAEFHVDHLDSFIGAAKTADSILYIADNAGEIVLDSLLIEMLGYDKVTLAVRGAPILNDVTRLDAQEVGLDKLVKVVDTGLGVPGIILDEASDEFLDAYDRAQLIVSKGQANFEALCDVSDRKIVFLFMAKCHRVAEMIGAEVGDYLIYDNSRA